MEGSKVPRSKARVSEVDEGGVRLWGFGDRVLDVLFDGRRVWSFWLVRDTEGAPTGRRHAAWPPALSRFLDGHTRVSVRDHLTGETLFDQERAFGTSSARIAVVGKSGAPMGLDKSGRMSATFDTRSPEDVAPLLDSIDRVLEAIRTAGIEAFLAYGTLLGAIREQRLLGHDSDADLAYVSHASTPVDVIRESFRLQRAVTGLGLATHRYSGAAFRIDVVEGDGVVRALDVFAGFIDGGRLRLMGEVDSPYEMDWIYPTRECTLEGRPFPAPAAPERLLEAMYGPSWAVPDPAFRFGTDQHTIQELTGWFRGTSVERQAWERSYSRARMRVPRRRPSQLARRALGFVGQGGTVLDVGAGWGADSLWLARQGAQVTAYDYVPKAPQTAQRVAAAEGLRLDVRHLNLTEWRSVLGEGALASRRKGRRAVLARHVADATNGFGRDSLARFSSMALRDGGRLFVDVWTGGGTAPLKLRPVSLDALAGQLEGQGATIIRTRELAPGEGGNRSRFSIGRLVAQWD
ncbi:class I SAM-dependent methyltransferase [Nocardioides sp. cx-169]|uniref:class I SAM-dependent methyltransferase n=1 Tax=Nocardioides sp. cx-169 TaxID=2899080 RepID=UPI001E58223C|nr:class I SAM-dependent methyltransferase [Nocardioides sp. cx-169]MCD4534163.1 class I SAM-dependent methyltransferase [Nocardioides sp. cx-169]